MVRKILDEVTYTPQQFKSRKLPLKDFDDREPEELPECQNHMDIRFISWMVDHLDGEQYDRYQDNNIGR